MVPAPRPTRVLHVIDSLAASGGAERRFVDEVVALGDRFEQRVVRLFPRDELQATLEAAGIAVVDLGLSGRHSGRTWPLAAWRLRREIRRWRPDVVHTSLVAANLAGQLATRRGRVVPVVSSFNRTGELDLQQALQPGMASRRGRFLQRVARWTARPSTVHHRAVSEYARVTNAALYGLDLDRVTAVPRGIDLPAATGDRARFGIADGVPLLVNVARLVPEKRQDLLVEAFDIVHRQRPDAVLAIAGADGSHGDVVRAAIADRHLGEHVRLLGWRPDVPELVASADAFVFSSLSEGSPSAVVEAMALGTPVVAFGISPVAEVTGGHARLVEPGSVDGLAAAMLAVLDAGRDDETSAAARKWAAGYDLAAVAARLGDLLEARARA